MSKYIDLNEAIDLFKGIDATMTGGWVADTLEAFTTIDIVTCDECKRWIGESEWYEDREYRRCQNGGLLTSLNHYCAWGERIEE